MIRKKDEVSLQEYKRFGERSHMDTMYYLSEDGFFLWGAGSPEAVETEMPQITSAKLEFKEDER